MMIHLSKVRGHPFKKSVSKLQSSISSESPHNGFDKTADLEQWQETGYVPVWTHSTIPALSVIPGQVSPKSFEGSKPAWEFW